MSAATRKSGDAPTVLDSIKLLAVNYKASGNGERAEGLMQAAAMVDMEGYRMSGRSLVEALDVMLRQRLDDYVADVVAAVLDALAKQDVAVGRPETRRRGPPRDASPKASPRRKHGYGDRPLEPLPVVEIAVPNFANWPKLAAGARKVLVAAAQHPAGVSRAQLTVLTGYKKSTRDTYLQQLLQHVLLAKTSGGDVIATEAGRAWLGPDFRRLPTGNALRLYWCNELPEGEGRVLKFVSTFYPHVVSSDRISAETGYSKSSRDTYLQRLVARRLVEKTGPGHYCAAALLFDEVRS